MEPGCIPELAESVESFLDKAEEEYYNDEDEYCEYFHNFE